MTLRGFSEIIIWHNIHIITTVLFITTCFSFFSVEAQKLCWDLNTPHSPPQKKVRWFIWWWCGVVLVGCWVGFCFFFIIILAFGKSAREKTLPLVSKQCWVEVAPSLCAGSPMSSPCISCYGSCHNLKLRSCWSLWRFREGKSAGIWCYVSTGVIFL